jgi:hypothetical protein
MPRGRHIRFVTCGLSGLVGAPQVTRSAATPVGNAVSSEIREIARDFKGHSRGARDSVTKLRRIQANSFATEARLCGDESRLFRVETKLRGVDAWLDAARVRW